MPWYQFTQLLLHLHILPCVYYNKFSSFRLHTYTYLFANTHFSWAQNEMPNEIAQWQRQWHDTHNYITIILQLFYYSECVLIRKNIFINVLCRKHEKYPFVENARLMTDWLSNTPAMHPWKLKNVQYYALLNFNYFRFMWGLHKIPVLLLTRSNTNWIEWIGNYFFYSIPPGT